MENCMKRIRRFQVRAAAALLLLPVGAACSASGSAPGAADDGGTAAGTRLTVFAAASLRGTFTELADRFEAENPGMEVALSFAGSADLASQISQGAPADVFAAADTATMGRLQEAGLTAGHPDIFATNTLAIAVPPGNPADITGFGDLARSGVKLVVCAGQVPCGAVAEKLEAQTGTALAPVSEENSVTDVLGKVASGEADAGLVYATDVLAAGERVEGIQFPESTGAVNSYPIAAVKGSPRQEAAQAFITLATGAGGRKILAGAGFGPPDS